MRNRTCIKHLSHFGDYCTLYMHGRDGLVVEEEECVCGEADVLDRGCSIATQFGILIALFQTIPDLLIT